MAGFGVRLLSLLAALCVVGRRPLRRARAADARGSRRTSRGLARGRGARLVVVASRCFDALSVASDAALGGLSHVCVLSLLATDGRAVCGWSASASTGSRRRRSRLTPHVA